MKNRTAYILTATTLVAAIAACSDTPMQPQRPDQLDQSQRSAATGGPDHPLFAAASASGRVAGQYIVVFDKAVSDPPGLARRLATEEGAEIRHTYRHALKGFAARMSAQAAERIARNPHVVLVEEDQVMRATTTQSNATWGLDRVDQRTLPLSGSYTYTPTGAGVTVYIIDTGIRFDHTEFGGRAVSGYDAIDGGSADDCNGHGTHVAGTVGGTIYGVAKSAKLVGVRVLDCSGSGTTSGVIAGIDWVTANAAKPAVANMSLGGGASAALDDAVRRSIAIGVTYAIAAGNDNLDACGASPARVTEGITVGASSSTDARAGYSNYGSCVDLFAPGSNIASAWHTGTTTTNTISGTSMATPHVAGVAALYLQGNASASPATVISTIVNSATSGALTGIGTGSPNKLLFSPLTTDGSSVGGGGTTDTPSSAPCTSCTAYSGTLSGPGAYQYQPNGTHYYSATSGYHKGWLRAGAGTDFDLYLYKWSSYYGRWLLVARAESATSAEQISYSGTAGYYLWEVSSYSGSGSYTFWLQKP